MKRSNLPFREMLLICVLVVEVTMAQKGRPPEITNKFVNIQRLNIGDQCPDFLFSPMLNYPAKEAKLSDFHNQYIILDFWATWCAGCLLSMPKMEALQEKYKGRLQILELALDSIEKCKWFLSMKPDFKLPICPLDSAGEILKYCPHLSLPHYVWIDQNRMVRAITASPEVNDSNISKFLDGYNISLTEKDKPGIAPAPTVKSEDPVPDSSIISKKVIGRYAENALSYSSYGVSGFEKNRMVRVSNSGLRLLYQMAYLGPDTWDRTRIIVETPDSAIFKMPKGLSSSGLMAWVRKYCYCYELWIPEQDSLKLYKIMREDITSYFGYKGKIEEREVDCMTIVVSDPNLIKKGSGVPSFDENIYSISMKNEPVKTLVESILHLNIFDFKPIIDDTGLGLQGIDLEVRANLKDFGKLRSELNKNGIDLVRTKKKLKMLVIY